MADNIANLRKWKILPILPESFEFILGWFFGVVIFTCWNQEPLLSWTHVFNRWKMTPGPILKARQKSPRNAKEHHLPKLLSKRCPSVCCWCSVSSVMETDSQQKTYHSSETNISRWPLIPHKFLKKYTPENEHGTQKWRFGRWLPFSIRWFSGSM